VAQDIEKAQETAFRWGVVIGALGAWAFDFVVYVITT
jgi:hypothetical protein